MTARSLQPDAADPFDDDERIARAFAAATAAACHAMGIEDYRVHDQRHSYAVRAARAGTPAELIARQLGHVDAILVLKVYGRFMLSQQERDRWERIAAQQDAASLLARTPG